MKKENVLGFALNANDMIRSPDCGIGHIRDINATPFGRRLRGCKATPVVMKSQHNQLPAADFPYVETHRFLAARFAFWERKNSPLARMLLSFQVSAKKKIQMFPASCVSPMRLKTKGGGAEGRSSRDLQSAFEMMNYARFQSWIQTLVGE